MIRGFCFDMDGVLFDSERVGYDILRRAALRQNAELTRDQWHSLLGASMAHTRQAIKTWYDGRVDADRFLADWLEETLAYARTEGIPLKPHARETLDGLRWRGMRLALCTSNAPEVVDAYLGLSGLDRMLDQVVTGPMVAHGKPAPDIYLLGAQRLGLPPEECAGVEDSFNGVRAVRAAGMYSVMVPDVLPYAAQWAPYVDLCLHDLSELEHAIWMKE